MHVASCNVMGLGERNCPCNAWKVCFVIFSIQEFHKTFGSAAHTHWFLGQACVLFECPGNARFELQIIDIPHGQENFINGDGLLLKSSTVPRSCKVCLPLIRSYNGGMPPRGYSTIFGHRCTLLLAEYSTKTPTFLF